MKIILFILLVIAVALMAMVAYLPWWVSVVVVVALVLAAKLLGGRLLELLFSLPFKAKGAVLRGASVELHKITPMTLAVARQMLKHKVGADADGENPELEASRNYFVVELTVTPMTGSSCTFGLWEPGELLLAGPDAKSKDSADDAAICRIERREISNEGRFELDEGMKYEGPQRLRLTLGVAHGFQRLQFRYYFELFGGFTLPG